MQWARVLSGLWRIFPEEGHKDAQPTDTPYLPFVSANYWIFPLLPLPSYRQCFPGRSSHLYYLTLFNAGSAKCSTKGLSQLLTTLLTAVKDGLQSYCETTYSRYGINQMWILKNSKCLLENLKSNVLQTISCVNSYDFSILYTTIPHSKLKSSLKDLIFTISLLWFW